MNDQFQDIIDAIEACQGSRHQLISQLAYHNNLAEPGDGHLLKGSGTRLKPWKRNMRGNITGITGWVMLCIIWTENSGQSIILKKRWSTGGSGDAWR